MSAVEFQRLLKEHEPRLLAMLRQRIGPALGSRVAAEDVLTEAYLKAYHRWSRNRDEQPGLPSFAWLSRLAQDCYIEACRHNTRACRDMRRVTPWPDGSSVDLGLVSPDTTPSEAYERQDLKGRMSDALDELEEPDREVLTLRNFDGLSLQEIAARLGLSYPAVTMRYARALRRLKAVWNRRYPNEEHQG